MKLVCAVLLLLLAARVGSNFLLSEEENLIGQSVKFQVILDREPQIRSGKQVIRYGEIIIYAPIVPELHFGEGVEVSGRVECLLVAGDCVGQAIYRPEIIMVEALEAGFWQRAVNFWRSRFRETYRFGLSAEEADLASGIVLGSLGMNQQFKNRLANVGLTHVVAASGMNISLFSGFVMWFLTSLRFSKIYKALLTILLIGFYSSITGFEPPIVRATIMAVVMIIGGLIGRQNSAMWGLLVAAYVMLWVAPSLLTSASFLLSFFSMMGQVTLGDLRQRALKDESLMTKLHRLLVRDVWQSFSSIIFTLPIVVFFFSKFSLVALVTNFLVLWSIEPIMILGGLGGLVGLISLDLARLVLLPASVLLDYFIWVVNLFNHDAFLLRVGGLNGWMVVGYYFFLFGTVWWWKENQRSVRM